jgi:hypothetical protein
MGKEMRVLTIERRTMAQAEDVIAMMWRMLEKYRMPTPKLHVRVADVVLITIEFLSDPDAYLIQRVTSKLAPASATACD